MFTCSSPYGLPGSSSNGHHQRLSTSSSIEDQPPSFSSEFCSPPAANQSFNAFLPSSTDVPIHHALTLSSFENNNDITCHPLKLEPSLEPLSYQQQQPQQQLLQQPQQQQALLGIQQTPHHSTSLLMQSSLSGMGSNGGSIIPPITSLNRQMPLSASHLTTSNGETAGGGSGHDLLSSSIVTPPIMLPQPPVLSASSSSSSSVTTSASVMDLMVSTPSSVPGHQTHHRDPGEPPPNCHFGMLSGGGISKDCLSVLSSNSSPSVSSCSALTNGSGSLLETRHSNLVGSISNGAGSRIMGGGSGSGPMMPVPSYQIQAIHAAAAAAAALCTPHQAVSGDMRLNGGSCSVGSMQPVDLTHQHHHQQQQQQSQQQQQQRHQQHQQHQHHHQPHHPHQTQQSQSQQQRQSQQSQQRQPQQSQAPPPPQQQQQQQPILVPNVVMGPQQHSTSSTSSATSMTITSYQQQQQHHQQQSNLGLSSVSPLTGTMNSDWAFVDHNSRCLASSTPVTTSCVSSDLLSTLPAVTVSVPMDPLTRSFLANSNGTSSFASQPSGCISNVEDGRRERTVSRSQHLCSVSSSSSSSTVVGRCGVEEPLLTNLETWKVVAGEPMEMDVNGGTSDEPSGMASTAPSVVSVMAGTISSHAGMHIGPPILSRQGSVDELITHCLSSETETMLTDPDLWQILGNEGNIDHTNSVMEDHDSMKIKRSLSTDHVCGPTQMQLLPGTAAPAQPAPSSSLSPTRTPPSLLPVASMAPSTPSQHGSDAYTPSPTSSLPSFSGDGPSSAVLTGCLTGSAGSIITSHFWKYNAQSKGPKARRMDLRDPGASKDSKINPYRLVEFRDPVQDRNDLIHCTKIRKGDGNDITPNPLKLHKMGLELNRLNGQIQAVVNTTEGDRVKKEKNRIASQSCRLKRKAYNEANKIKLFGLGLEHRELLDVLSRVKKELARRVALVEKLRRRGNAAGGEENRDPATGGDSSETVSITMGELMRTARRELNKTRVSGRSDLYVGEVLEEVWRQENANAAAAAAAAAASGSGVASGVSTTVPCGVSTSVAGASVVASSTSGAGSADLGLIRPPD